MARTVGGGQSACSQAQACQENLDLPLYPLTVVRNQSCSGHSLYIGAYDLCDNRRLELLGQLSGFLGGSQQLDKAAPRGHALAHNVFTDFFFIKYIARNTARHKT